MYNHILYLNYKNKFISPSTKFFNLNYLHTILSEPFIDHESLINLRIVQALTNRNRRKKTPSLLTIPAVRQTIKLYNLIHCVLKFQTTNTPKKNLFNQF